MTENDGRPQPVEGLEMPAVDGVLDRSLALVEFLRQHCAWDRAQTAGTLVRHLLEESHEVADAVRDGDDEALEGELGDLLLNVAFQVVVAEEAGRFDRKGVVRHLEDKMARRHPHLFGLGEREEWEAVKAREAGQRPGDARVLSGIARGLDPLLKAHRIQEKVSGVGFDWEDASGALEKVEEELGEVREALAGGSSDQVEEELGDLLFAAVNLTRLAGLHAGTALDAANRKFRERFERLEDLAKVRGVDIPGASLEALDALWEELKAQRQAPDSE